MIVLAYILQIIFNLIGKEIESLKYMSFVHVRLTKPSIFRKNNSNIIVPLLYLTILCKYHTNIQYQVAINLTRKKDVFFPFQNCSKPYCDDAIAN